MKHHKNTCISPPTVSIRAVDADMLALLELSADGVLFVRRVAEHHFEAWSIVQLACGPSRVGQTGATAHEAVANLRCYLSRVVGEPVRLTA